jgi:glycosyltransferase involved in cell wall biosynthesis
MLKQLIDSLEEQNFDDYQIELCISDNASSDDTRNYLESLSLTKVRLSLNFNVQNCGLEPNMIKVMQMASGKYILPIGDDDCFMSNSISSIIEMLESEPDLLILNGFNTNNDLKIESEYMPDKLKNKNFSSPVLAFPNLWGQMRLSSFVSKNEILDLEEHNRTYEKYIGTSHAYSALPWDGLSKKYNTENQCQIICMEKPTILFRNGPKTWSEQKLAILFSEIPEWFERLPELYNDVKNLERDKYMQNIAKVRMLVAMRAGGLLNEESVKKYMNKYSHNQQKLAKLVCLLPIWLAILIQDTKQFIKSLFFASKSTI